VPPIALWVGLVRCRAWVRVGLSRLVGAAAVSAADFMLTPGAGREPLQLGKVTFGLRLRAMAVLQEHRPDLDH
jgi:hypothetical protein